jgi:hypothetical protein
MPNLDDRVKVVRGAARDVRLYLFDEQGMPEDLSGYQSAALAVILDEGSPPLVTRASSGAGSDADGAFVTFPLSGADTLLLPAGTYLCDARVTLGGTAYQTARFYLESSEAIST